MSSITMSARKKGYRGLGMEGPVARWYARLTGGNKARFGRAAQELAAALGPGASVLEVAPGPGYLAIELAKLGSYRVVGLDFSDTFVRMATENAKTAGVPVTFQRGNAAALPFDPESFDLIVCQAAFKNFSEPVRALAEMHRVLKPGGRAVIFDLRRDAPAAAIKAEVESMGLGPINALVTKLAFKHMLLKRAYSQDQFRVMVAETPFAHCAIELSAIGLSVVLTK
jgi:ubiquinone/menaquinone biosynthesis C-methylase UbiE